MQNLKILSIKFCWFCSVGLLVGSPAVALRVHERWVLPSLSHSLHSAAPLPSATRTAGPLLARSASAWQCLAEAGLRLAMGRPWAHPAGPPLGSFIRHSRTAAQPGAAHSHILASSLPHNLAAPSLPNFTTPALLFPLFFPLISYFHRAILSSFPAPSPAWRRCARRCSCVCLLLASASLNYEITCN